ncbi:branched-chain amino acid ABC transporter permease [Candidatus Dependentiae bacterium]|nr:branched-chain amino acid ABC transporter permease [Candidatus Dependentiae bacterium]
MSLRKEKKGLFLFFIIIIILPFILNKFQAGGYYLGVLVPIGLFSLAAIGLNLLIGFAGQISLGHAGFMSAGAYSSVYICSKLGYSAVYGLILSIIVNGILAYIISKPILKLKGHYLAMATLGIGIIIHIIFRELMYFGGGEGISVPELKIGSFNFNDYKIKEISYFYLSWSMTFFSLLLSINFINSKSGRALKAIHLNEIAANALGINVASYKTFIFVYSAILAGIAGSLIAHYNAYILPSTFDLHTSIKLVSMVILGGVMNIWGAILGAFIIMILPELLGKFDEYEGLIYGGIIILTMIFFPEGLIFLIKKCVKHIIFFKNKFLKTKSGL